MIYYNVLYVERRNMEDKLRRAYSKKHRRSFPGKFRYGRVSYRNPRSRHPKRRNYIIIAVLILALAAVLFTVFQKKQEADRKTIGNFLLTALKPVGSTMYIWGGGWSDEDTDSGAGSTRIGVSPEWAKFAQKQDETYNYRTTRYQREKGLDCSGYVAWCVYNVMESRSGKEGYVLKATCMALNYAKRGWGDFSEVGEVKTWKAGDIMSMEGHVWMVVGSCSDGSVVILHYTPPGVALAGTLLADGSESEATKLAEQYMSNYYPNWYARYPECKKPYTYLTDSASMSWNRKTLSDKEGLTEMSAEEVLKWMFANQ